MSTQRKLCTRATFSRPMPKKFILSLVLFAHLRYRDIGVNKLKLWGLYKKVFLPVICHAYTNKALQHYVDTWQCCLHSFWKKRKWASISDTGEAEEAWNLSQDVNSQEKKWPKRPRKRVWDVERSLLESRWSQMSIVSTSSKLLNHMPAI